MNHERGLLVDGAWSSGTERLPVLDPATGGEVGTTAVASADDVARAVAAARAAAPAWGRTSAADRARILHRAADLITERIDAIALTLTLEQGKPLGDSIKEIAYGAEVLHYYAEEATRSEGSIRQSSRSDVTSIVERLPVGVVAAIVPWNYPVDLYCWKVAPALAAGNAVVVKPPLEAPLAAGRVSQCLVDAGVPAGVLADLPGALEAGQALSASPGIDMITATASTATGRAIMRAAAGTMKRVTLELGGQSPFVVLEDADVQDAAVAACRRSFSNTGQICIAVNRILVATAIADEFTEALAAATERITLGHGTEDGVTCGPATTEGVLQVAETHIADALRRGARLVTGGGRAADLPTEGRFFSPTVLAEVPLDALAMREETFGPVVAVHRFDSDEEAVRIANGTPYGLAAYVYGRDLDRAWRVAESLEFGGVGVNVNDVTELHAPFGGWKMSGFGRELGPEGLQGFQQQRHIRLRRAPAARS